MRQQPRKNSGGQVELKQLERVYSLYAGVYDRLFGKVFQQGRESAIRRLAAAPGERILEVGVGTGLTLSLYPAHCEVIGIDLSAGMLEKARERIEADGIKNALLTRANAANLPFADSCFDTVVAAYVVTAVPDYEQLMGEMIRVCRPAGRIVLLNHFVNGNKLISAVERAISPLCEHVGFRTDLSVQHVLNGNPLAIKRHDRVRPFGMWHLIECSNEKHMNGHALARLAANE